MEAQDLSGVRNVKVSIFIGRKRIEVMPIKVEGAGEEDRHGRSKTWHGIGWILYMSEVWL